MSERPFPAALRQRPGPEPAGSGASSGAPADRRRRLLLRVLGIGLPTLAGAIVALTFVWPEIVPRDDRVRVGVAVVEEAPEDDRAGMIGATFSGVDGKGRPFSVSAERISNAPDDERLMQLSRPDATIVLESGTPLNLSARDGTYDRREETVDLRGDVRLRREGELTVETSEATIALQAGTAVGRAPVEASGRFGTVSGRGFRVTDDGASILVEGPARLVVEPSAGLQRP